jgi:hypothetical protein
MFFNIIKLGKEKTQNKTKEKKKLLFKGPVLELQSNGPWTLESEVWTLVVWKLLMDPTHLMCL